MKAVHLKAVDLQDAVYVSTDNMEEEEDINEDSMKNLEPKVDNPFGVPVAYTQLGQGFLGYVGDVNGEEESTYVIICMFHL